MFDSLLLNIKNYLLIMSKRVGWDKKVIDLTNEINNMLV